MKTRQGFIDSGDVELLQSYDDKVESGMPELKAARETINEAFSQLTQELIDFKTEIGLQT